MVRNFYLPLGFVASCIVAGSSIWTSCDDAESCAKCGGEIKSAFDHKYFGLLANEVDTFLISNDSSANVKYVFNVCSNELLKSVEDGKIIQASGSFRNSCDNPNVERIALDDVQLVTSCLPPIPQLDGPYSLDNTWFIHYLQIQDTIVYPPCEGSSYARFDSSEKNIDGSMSLNGFAGSYAVINDSTIRMPSSFGVTLSVGTLSQTFFENTFQLALGPNSAITYSINKNILVLKNKADNAMIRLFLTE